MPPGRGGCSRRDQEVGPDTEVIMLTGHATLESGTQAMRKGAYDYLMKPCDMRDLVEKIKGGPRSRRNQAPPVLWPRKLVREIALHLSGSSSRGHLVQSPGDHEPGRRRGVIEEVYVVDREDRPLGIVTQERSCERGFRVRLIPIFAMEWSQLLMHPQWLPQKTMKEVMRPQPLTTQATLTSRTQPIK